MEYLLYKQIVSGDANIFANAVLNASELTMRMHCIGGSVYEGIAIANTVSRIENGTCIIEGVAASMGFVIACSFKKVKARRSARMMCHEITASSVQGNAKRLRESADDVEKNNTIIAEMIAKKVGQTADWVKENWMQPNVNKWFNADEALAAGLIDEIIEDDAVLNNNLELTSLQNDDLINFYDEHFHSSKNKKSNTMDELNSLLAVADIKDFKGNEQQAVALLSAKMTNQKNVIDTLKAQLQKVQDAELTALLDEKKVPTKQRQEYINIANKMGMDTVKVVLSNLTSPVVTLTGITTTTDRTYAEWEKEDPKGLLEMMNNDPEQFNALLETY